METQDLVFVGFNSRVAALDRLTGELRWQWKSPEGSGFVALLLDGDQLIASVQGYTFALNPLTGEQIWHNPLPGFGTGVPSLVSVYGQSDSAYLAAEEMRQAQAAASAAT
jgi:outer membrane protein assembly factor BamB